MILVPTLEEIRRTSNSPAEILVATLLSELDFGDNARAFHSLRLRSHRYKRQAEIDFLVLIKGAVLIVEVKGGGIVQRDRKWWTVTRRGDSHLLKESPMKQAQDAGFALQEILSEENMGWYPWEALVITPDVKDIPGSAEWKSTHWLTGDDMTSKGLADALRKVLNDVDQPPQTRRRASDSDLRKQFYKDFTRLPSIDSSTGRVLEQQHRATVEQARILAISTENDRIIVKGGAGTGKTLVAAELAKQEAALGKTALLTFRSPSLRTVMETYVEGHSVVVMPFAETQGLNAYDVVVVDEAQDLMTVDDMDHLDKIVKGGREGGRWRMFMDPNNQIHVDGAFDSDVFELVRAGATVLTLPKNVRNTESIVHVVRQYLGADIGDPGTVHGEKVEWKRVSDGDLNAAVIRARELVDQGAGRDRLWLIDMASTDEPRTVEGFQVVSPRAVKGLEREHVVAYGWPSTVTDEAIASVYVALTRARVSLSILVSTPEEEKLKELLGRVMSA